VYIVNKEEHATGWRWYRLTLYLYATGNLAQCYFLFDTAANVLSAMLLVICLMNYITLGYVKLIKVRNKGLILYQLCSIS